MVCILVSSYGMVVHTSPLSGRAGRPLLSGAWYGIHILAIYQSISGSARPYINQSWWAALALPSFINTPRYIAPHHQHRHTFFWLLCWQFENTSAHQGRVEYIYISIYWPASADWHQIKKVRFIIFTTFTSVTHVRTYIYVPKAVVVKCDSI